MKKYDIALNDKLISIIQPTNCIEQAKKCEIKSHKKVHVILISLSDYNKIHKNCIHELYVKKSKRKKNHSQKHPFNMLLTIKIT
jgi:hypothetical protein